MCINPFAEIFWLKKLGEMLATPKIFRNPSHDLDLLDFWTTNLVSKMILYQLFITLHLSMDQYEHFGV